MKDRNYYTEFAEKLPQDTVILTAEKDMVKLDELLPNDEKVPFYYLPIQCEIINGQDAFLAQLKAHIIEK